MFKKKKVIYLFLIVIFIAFCFAVKMLMEKENSKDAIVLITLYFLYVLRELWCFSIAWALYFLII